jgi:hypothetical protein
MHLLDTIRLSDDWMYGISSMAICIYMLFGTHSIYKKVIARFEKKYRVKIVARQKAYVVTGPHPWWKLFYIEIKLFITFFIVYFFPLLLIGIIGWVLGVFR